MSSTKSIHIVDQSLKDNISSLLAKSVHFGYSFACWSLPGDHAFEAIIDLNKEPIRCTPELESMAPGFLASPFLTGQDSLPYFIQEHIRFSNDFTNPTISPFVTDSLLPGAEEFLNLENDEIKIDNISCFLKKSNTSTKKGFINYTSFLIDKINSGFVQKVVAARNKTISFTANAENVVDIFLKAREKYKNAFISLVHIPGAGIWIGATPELLLEISKNFIFHTVALAGTQPYKGQSTSEAMWRQKEINEQALVSRYIIECLKKIRLREYCDEGPKTIIAGELMHLQTDFYVDMKALRFFDLGSIMLDLLHPTSAVCGMPKDKATILISEHENLDRGLYSGYLGPVNQQNGTNLYVNLRCAQFMKDSVQLYAGAGITFDSDPEQEWEETELKCRTMGQLFA